MTHDTTSFFLDVIYLFIPIVAANQAGMFGKALNLPGGHTPVSITYLGENKTVAPYYLGPFLATLVMGFPFYPAWLIPYSVLVGLCVVLGDHVKSALKRLLGKPPGSPWWLDRIDFAVGGVLAMKWSFTNVTWWHVLGVIALAWPVHFFGNKLGYALGLRKTPW